MAIKKVLELHHFGADIESDSDSGFAAAVDPDYDLIVLDRMLPGSMEGLEVCQRVRKEGVQTPILMLTARGEIDDIVSGLAGGADDYLVKPFSMMELVARIHVLLRRPATTIGPVVQIDDLEANLEMFTVKRSGVNIRLSAREYELLAYLSRHQGQVLSKEQIVSHVWDGDSSIVMNTVEVYMGHLRRKIDRAFPDRPQLIHTIHGFGYKLAPAD